MRKPAPYLLASVLALAAVSPAHASPIDDFAFALKEHTGGAYAPSWVLTKLTSFKLGAKCAARLDDKSEGALHAASFATRDIIAYAKTVTGDDWSAIENQSNSDREKNKELVEPKMDAFKARLAFNISVDGDDCDAKGNSLWLRYWTTLATSLRNNPPKATKVTINLVVTSKAKEVTSEVSKDGSTFTFTAPRDLESTDWSDRLDRPFRKLAAGLPDDFSFGLKEYTGRFSSAWVLSRMHTFKVGKKCLARLGDPTEGLLHRPIALDPSLFVARRVGPLPCCPDEESFLAAVKTTIFSCLWRARP